MQIGNCQNGWKPNTNQYVNLPLGNIDMVAETAVVATYLITQNIAAIEEVKRIKDKIFTTPNGLAKCNKIVEVCREVAKQI